MRIATEIQPLTANEVSLWLGVHVNTVKKIPWEELPFFRVGSRGDRRYFPSTVRAYIDRRSNP